MKSNQMNLEVREAIKNAGIKNYEIANALGISTVTFSFWMQSELSQERKERVLKAVKNFKKSSRKRANQDIRAAIKAKGLNNYEVANVLGISPISFYRWLQIEMSTEKKNRVFAAIDCIND